MHVTLDEQTISVTGDRVDDALRAAADAAESASRVIVEVVVDGTPWGDAELSSDDARSSAAERVELSSTNLVDLVVRTLNDASEALTNADQLQRDAAERLQDGRAQEGYVQLGEAITIWQQVGEAVERSRQALDLDFATVELDGVAADEVIRTLDDQLRMVRASLQDDDPVSLADTLLYDFPTIIVRWRELLQALIQSIHGTTS